MTDSKNQEEFILEVDMLVVSAGIRPRDELAKQLYPPLLAIPFPFFLSPQCFAPLFVWLHPRLRSATIIN